MMNNKGVCKLGGIFGIVLAIGVIASLIYICDLYKEVIQVKHNLEHTSFIVEKNTPIFPNIMKLKRADVRLIGNVEISLKDAKGKTSTTQLIASGSGTVVRIDKDYIYVLTAKHVVQTDELNPALNPKLVLEIEMPLKDERTSTLGHPLKDYEYVKVTTENIYVSKEEDVALIRVPFKITYIIESLTLAKYNPPIGEQVYIMGCPAPEIDNLSEGIVSNYAYCTACKSLHFMFTAGVSPGSSGSSVVNKRTEIVGVVTQKKDFIGVGVSLPAVRDFIQEAYKYYGIKN